jgi:threonyl-tRNA synthetase
MGKKNPPHNGASAASAFHVSATRKWSVMDAPGVSQPDWSAAVSSAPDPSMMEAQQQSSGSSHGVVVAAAKEGLQGRRATKSSGGSKISAEGSIGGDSFTARESNPGWISQRVAAYDKIAARRQAELSQKVQVPISVTLPDGKVLRQDKSGAEFAAWKTTPFDVASAISTGLADASTVAKVTYQDFVADYRLEEDGMTGDDTLMSLVDSSGEAPEAATSDANNNNSAAATFLWDMTRPLVGNVKLIEFLKFEESTEAKTVFWHSSAHIMGEALEHLFGCKLTIGPPLAGGFYYDSYMNTDALREEDCTCIRLVVDRNTAWYLTPSHLAHDTCSHHLIRRPD